MKNKTLKISVSLIIIFISFIISVHAEENMMFPVCTNGCHTDRGISYGITEEEWCGSCHLYVSKSLINIPALEETHNPKTCTLCHTITESSTFHARHVNVTGSCNRCHGELGSAIPTSTFSACAGCHSGQIHEIHDEVKETICLNCHGIRPIKNAQNAIDDTQGINKVYAKVIDYNRYTLLELIKSLFGWK